MQKQNRQIAQYDLSPLAKAGILINRIEGIVHREEHDIFTPHRDSHYLLIVSTEGYSKMMLDFEMLEMKAPCMLLIQPGQVHQAMDIGHPRGWSIGFDPSLINQKFEQVLKDGFKDAQTPVLHQRVARLAELMYEVQTGARDNYTAKSVHTLLEALLSLIAGALSSIESDARNKDSRGCMIERAFSQLLGQHYKQWKKPSQYAESLSISVAHLNDTVKGRTGSSVSDHIQQQSILEAKRLLFFTDLSVKEVGYEMGYDDPAYFSKLFKKVTGMGPGAFRVLFRS